MVEYETDMLSEKEMKNINDQIGSNKISEITDKDTYWENLTSRMAHHNTM